MPVSKEALDEIALSEDEYRLIVERLGREPNPLELGMFGALWSEHCGYKHSKPLLELLPASGPRVLVPPGEENAGVIDIGDGLAVVMKIESHNHPSAIEPYQGAATGVGGIVRDIFAMGARPMALLNSLRFGPLGERRNRYLFQGVVGGISAYGNCIGVPDVGGEVLFSPSYSENPLVNAMCVGLVETKKLVKAGAKGVGNLLMLVGADTGRDGIHGASGLASRTFEEERELRSAVQVGNPFLEKVLIELCLQIADTDYITGLQDLGAAGLTSATVECAARAGSGVVIDIAKVPRREKGMNPYEVMLSESQERMLIVVKRGCEDKVKAILERWDLPSAIIGYVTDDGMARVLDEGKVVAEVSVQILTDPPLYRKEGVEPEWLKPLQTMNLDHLPDLPDEASQVLLKLLSSPNIASKEWIYRQYDHHVQTNTVIPPGADAAVLRIKGTKKAIALTTDGNGRYCYLDPRWGGAMAVAEAARNLVCSGAQPLAITDCLNFGNPERPDVYYQLEECILGMAEACEVLQIPVVSGNVSLYNETRGQAVYPTPVIGMVGMVEDVHHICTMGFKDDGDIVLLLGAGEAEAGVSSALSGSEYLELIHEVVGGRPTIDLSLERRVQQCCLTAIEEGLLKSAHDCSDGGLAVALAESCIVGSIGFSGDWVMEGRRDAQLLGESPSRIVASVEPQNLAKLEEMAQSCGVPLRKLGGVGGKRFIVKEIWDLPLEKIEEAWRGGLEKALG
ncbi:MAG: phosphoribosylformylglycinamidine synthase subunit PurL [Dehalococcoidia bacterium]